MKQLNKPVGKKEKPSGKLSKILFFLIKNLLFLFVVCFLIHKVFEIQPAYKWVYNNLLKGNMAMVKKYPKASVEERFTRKLGTSYAYLHFLKSETPEDAVILYPSRDDFFPPDYESKFTGEPYNKLWATRFLYPRKLITSSEVEANNNFSEINYIAVVNGRNGNHVNDSIGRKIVNGIIPLNK